MEIVDQEEDVHELENMFGRIPIEIFIKNLGDTFQVLDVVRKLKPWNLSEEARAEAERAFMTTHAEIKNNKNPQYKKSERTKSSML